MVGRWTVNLILLILVTVLGIAVRQELASGLKEETLTGLDPKAITEVAIERPGKPAIRLSRTPNGWHMETPYAVAADSTRVDRLVLIAATPVHRSLPESARPDLLGLSPERARLTLDGLALRFGGTEPIGHRRYVAVGDQVHLIDDGFEHHLTAPATAYVSRRLLPTGFRVDSGTLDGQPLAAAALAILGGLTAARVLPAEEELSGRLLSLRAQGGGHAIRFLVSADGRRWTRVDLRLSYLLAEAPALQTEERGRTPPRSIAPFATAGHQ